LQEERIKYLADEHAIKAVTVLYDSKALAHADYTKIFGQDLGQLDL